MPNWSTTNYLLRGSREDIGRFCDTVNSCYDKPDIRNNDFGKLWLGNLCEAFGDTFDEYKSGLRGVLSPEPEDCPCFCGPSYSDESDQRLKPEVLEDGRCEIRFSVTHAWAPSEWFNNILKEKFPEVTKAWKSTDEFGNFHECLNPDLFGLSAYEIYYDGEADEFDKGDEDKVLSLLNELTEKNFTMHEILSQNDSFWQKMNSYNEAHRDDEKTIEFIIWKEVSA